MYKQLELALPPEQAADPAAQQRAAARMLGIPSNRITGVHVRRRSLDARSKQIVYRMQVDVWADEAPALPPPPIFDFPDVRDREPVVVVGCGPAGLFAALKLIQHGLKPIVLERGKDVRSRRRDLAALSRSGIVNPDSNYCFGEGGAGTYSDGKLYTRSNKRGDMPRILNLLVVHGADPNILVEAHPHIGTNRLPGIVQALTETIRQHGGEVLFDTKLADLDVDTTSIRAAILRDGRRINTRSIILATGHSARDIYHLLHRKQWQIEAKPFALGVRVEHPQALIDAIQYRCDLTAGRGAWLPPASYSLVEQVDSRGVFSFCMCPGGIIAPAATGPDEVVVNGWSPSKRNNPYANSGLVTAIEPPDWQHLDTGPLGALAYQQQVEQAAFAAGGGQLRAPAQRLTDFLAGRSSTTLPDCSYQPGLTSATLTEVLPPAVAFRLREGLKAIGQKHKGYITADAVLVAPESRTSAPVRIPRDNHSLQHPQIQGLFPCGEGAGYAGGILSAAMDGERVADAVALHVAATARP